MPTFVDIHIHTSDNPNKLTEGYDSECLVKKVRDIAGDNEILLSLSDHNAINKKAYLSLKDQEGINLLLGAEIHVRKHETVKPYHCHIIFNSPITNEHIDKISLILDELYPDKIVTDKTLDVPSLEDISNKFDDYDYLILPHGGQSHNTFDTAIEDGKQFDTTLERDIYFNHFDGFTARSNSGLEDTVSYLKRLGISEFVNLITCSDNYKPAIYPQSKAKTNDFVPTWMYAEPSFNGLRMSLSESTRLFYGKKPSTHLVNSIERVQLKNSNVDIDVVMQPGLNVVIGGSSSGKTMFVDSIYRKISGNYEGNIYQDYGLEKISIINKDGTVPHYIAQNFITTILQNSQQGIEDIQIIERVFPEDIDSVESIRRGLSKFKNNLYKFVDSIKQIDLLQDRLKKIPILTSLIITDEVQENIFDLLNPTDTVKNSIKLETSSYDTYIDNLDEISHELTENPLAKDLSKQIEVITKELDRIYKISQFSQNISEKIENSKKCMDDKFQAENDEAQTKKGHRNKLIGIITDYTKALRTFNQELQTLSNFDLKYNTKKITVQGHTLYIENSFDLSKESLLEAINYYLKRPNQIDNFSDITPEKLFRTNYKGQLPRIETYEKFSEVVFSRISNLNKKKYKITTNKGKDFDALSPGWKSAIIIDLILGYEKDLAPIIIDQPEDNLATNYINKGLVDLIRKVKTRKQIILVSHNATIPMLGDAQNVVVCCNDSTKITIRSASLEGSIGKKSIVDYIADLTDGGKASIKKRVKKYNLKRFKEE